MSSLSEHLLLRHVSTAQDRARPLVLNLCLRLPASARSISLSAEFTKAFLTAFEHPPDAHRGFDVPAAQVTYLGVLKQQHDKGLEPNTQSLEDGVAGWNVHGFRVRDVGSDAEITDDMTTTPLMQMLAQISPQQVGLWGQEESSSSRSMCHVCICNTLKWFALCCNGSQQLCAQSIHIL